MNKTIKTIKLVPAQGVQTELGKMFLYNASAVNRAIEQINASEAETLKNATNAAESAQNATQSAKIAMTEAGRAVSQATAAADSAQNALSQKTAAEEYAIAAKSSATAAAESAKKTEQNEMILQGYVDTAKEAATMATSNAASAKSSADAAADSSSRAAQSAKEAADAVMSRVKPATAEQLGGVIVGDSLNVDTSGTINISDENQEKIDKAISEKNITNCITEIPQDIKLEIVDGAVVLKAGSKGYRPNGAGVFNQITASTDISKTTSTDCVYMVVSWGLSSLELVNINSFFSGATQPVNPPKNSVWYDTTNNVIKETYDGGATWGGTLLFPLGIVTVSNGKVSSIDQVFNGFGYVGSTIFALPGVKGLIPNGRNEDGTLKNIEFVSNVVRTFTETETGNRYLMLNSSGFSNFVTVLYDEEKNILYNTNNPIITRLPCGTFTRETNGRIALFQPKTAFHAVDYSDFKNTVEEINNSISAVDSNAVHKTGNETIGGQKTFTSGTIWKKEDWDATENPASNKFASWSQVCDKNYTMLSYVETVYLTDGTVQQSFGARKEINGTKYTASIRTRVDASGNTFVELGNNPAGSSNGTQVATTYWTNAKFLPLAGGTITGVITTKSQIIFENASSAGHRGFLYKTSDGGLAMGIAKSDNSGWQSYQSFFTSGLYQMTVSDGTNTKSLNARPDGTLTWDGKPIVRLVAEQKATSANNYTWYRKYSDGWVEQGGIHHRGSAGDTVNLPIAMSNEYYELQLTAVNSGNIIRYAYANTHTSTYFKCGTADDSSVNNDGDVRWYVCGYAAS